MIDDVISFDYEIGDQANHIQKQLTLLNVLNLKLSLSYPVHIILYKFILCYCR